MALPLAGELPQDHMLARVVDVARSKEVAVMVAAPVSESSVSDVMISNAGSHDGGDPGEIPGQRWRKVLCVDANGVFFVCRGISHLEKTKGSIINTASVSGMGGDWGMAPQMPPRARWSTSRAGFPLTL
jgi:meso-butanediol dehydrogenase/(S,S)-butanediol dehydrogenase/diacetyl reductase